MLAGGPDAPRVTTLCYVSEKCRLYLNGQEPSPARTEPADNRASYVFEGIPLKKGWNHVLIEVVSRQLTGERPGTLAVRMSSSNREYLRQMGAATAVDETR